MKFSLTSALFLLVFVACEDKVNGIQPCTFPAATSKFQIVDSYCTGCVINFKFNNQAYKFAGNQFIWGTDSHCYYDDNRPPYCEGFSDGYSSSFFYFSIGTPTTDEEFLGSLGQKQPLLTYDSLRAHRYPAMNASLTIYDYCRNIFHASNDTDPTLSYNQIDSAQLLSENPFLLGDEMAQKIQKTYRCYGRFNTQVIVDGKQEQLTGDYTVNFVIWADP